MTNGALPQQVSFDVPVSGSTMRCVGTGTGEPVVFLHGNPTSSFLWRHVLPDVAASGRYGLAVDLIGMGGSGKPDIAYRLVDHIDYVRTLLAQLGLPRPTLVGHDWGGVIALHLADRDPGAFRGVAFLESHIHPIDRWSDMDGGREMFRQLRTPGVGERMVLDENFLVEAVLPGGMLRTPSDAEMIAYRAPYLEPRFRRPMLAWVRQIPIEGEPADVVRLVLANQQVIADPGQPTLLLHGRPGAVVGAAEVAWCRENGQALTVADVGAGTHFLPEDRPQQIAAELIRWLDAMD